MFMLLTHTHTHAHTYIHTHTHLPPTCKFLIKYKGMSFQHCTWLSGNDVDCMAMRSRKTLHRYLNKLDRGDDAPEEVEALHFVYTLL